MSAVAPAVTSFAPPRADGRSGYQPQLDGLRGIAIISVLLHHFDVHLPGLFDWGPVGVRIFFLLSGYLITLSLWRLHREVAAAGGVGYWSGLLGFHARRMARLLPVLYTMIAVACLMGLPEFRDAVGWHLAFLSNFYAVHVGRWPDAASHLWSLSVQEQFYLLWPFVILLTPRRVLPWLLLALVAGALGFRATIISLQASDFYRWVLLPGVIDSFAVGALVACARRPGQPLPFTRGWVAGVIALAALACYVAGRLGRFGMLVGPASAFIETLENLFFAWLLLRTIHGWRGWLGAVFENPALVYIGRISYGLYVFHVLVHVAVAPWLAHHGISVADHLALRALILIALSCGVAALSYHYVEAPLAAWVRRREGRVAGAGSPVPG